MGAETFTTIATGKTADDAFTSAVSQAQFDHGHSGYTGTIAEKGSFIMLKPSAERIEQIKSRPYGFDYDDEDPDWLAVDDKWGPAGCYQLDETTFFFFGWASS